MKSTRLRVRFWFFTSVNLVLLSVAMGFLCNGRLVAIEDTCGNSARSALASLPVRHVQSLFLLVAQVGKEKKGGGPADSEPAVKPRPRRVKQWYERYNWYETGAYVGGGLVVLVIVVVLYLNSQKTAAPVVTSSDVIGGYRLLNLMMTGQTSQVWEVVEVASSRHFAMKLLLPEKVVDQDHREMLYHEAQVGSDMAHPNIIRVIKMVKDQHNPYMVMEFFPAGNLKLRVMHKKWDFIKEKAHDIFRQAATGLAYMNASGWVHRDVKPDNIMVNSAGEVRLIDFALAVKASKGGFFSKKKGRSAGTRSYMSPEQVRGEWLDGRADIYSFGATMYEVVTGRPPFRAATPEDLLRKQIIEKPVAPKTHNPDVTDACSDLILKMLSKKREDRPKDFHEVLMAMRNIQIFKAERPQPGPKV